MCPMKRSRRVTQLQDLDLISNQITFRRSVPSFSGSPSNLHCLLSIYLHEYLKHYHFYSLHFSSSFAMSAKYLEASPPRKKPRKCKLRLGEAFEHDHPAPLLHTQLVNISNIFPMAWEASRLILPPILLMNLRDPRLEPLLQNSIDI